MNAGKKIAIIGGGPGGLMAAEILAKAGCKVSIYDRMPTMGRKFLMAGRGGLNLTHSEDLEQFISRYGSGANWLAPHIRAFSPDNLRAWCEGLGQETFVGTSGRVFPRSMKAAPLLRAWLKRLNELGVEFFLQHNWLGFDGDALKFTNAKQENILLKPDATLLALGGASWPRLGSDGSWAKILAECGVEIAPLAPSNCGFIVPWSNYFSEKFAGTPLKTISVSYKGATQNGEIMLTKQGIEGGPVYALSAALRDDIAKNGAAVLQLDLRPNMPQSTVEKKLGARGDQSLSNYLRKAGFSGAAASLLREVLSPEELASANLAAHIKNLPLKLTATSGLGRAISSAGGIKQSAVTENFMLRAKPNVFVCGEMLDWEAPTGGYLLQACFSTAVAAANGILKQ